MGIEILRNSTGVVLSQRKYALELLDSAGITNEKPAKTPLDPTQPLSSTEGSLLTDPFFYRTLVGKLLYLTITRPDLAFAAQALSQYAQHPRTSHLKALLRVMRYIKLIPGQGLSFPKTPSLNLHAFCDSDWAACTSTRRSVSGYCIFLGKCLVSWKSKK